jgi:hypothetical protein
MSPDEVIDPPPEPRPAVPRAPTVETELAPPPRRRWHGPVGVLLNDAGLKLLALVLAVMMWQLVRGRVETTDTVEGVVVEVRDLPPDLRLLGGNQRKVSLTLSGAAGDVRRVKADFNSTTSPIVLRLEDVDPDLAEGNTGSITNPLKFAYPVEGASDLVTQINPALRFQWFRVKDVEVTVGEPTLAPIPGRSDVELVPASVQFEGARRVRVTGPIEAVASLAAEGAVLDPDPVDASQWVEKGGGDSISPWPWESGFNRWRGAEELKGEDLLTIEPPLVKGRMRLRFVKTEPVENFLEVLNAPGTTAEDYAPWEIVITAGAGAYNADARTLRAGFLAEERVIRDLRDRKTSWSFGVRLPPPPRDGEKVPENERLQVFFLWLSGTATPAARLDDPNVLVTFKKKSP